jgi:O-antigen/teichoic acid export membrane protein
MRRLSTDVLAGATSSFVTLLAAIAATPLYLRVLGAEAFGVVGFVLSLQAALLVLDGGVALFAIRAIAQNKNESARRATANLVHGLARVSWYAAVAIVGLIALSATSLAQRWLKLGDLQPAYVAQSLVLAGVAIGARWPLGLYQGVLTGSHQIVAVSFVNALMIVLSTGGGVALMVWFVPDLRVLFAWLAAASLTQVFWCRGLARRALGAGQAPAKGEVLQFYRLSAAAGWLGLVGLLLMQVDKVVLSKVLPVGMFGYYVIAATMASGLYALVTPVFNVLYPRFAVLALEPGRVELRRLYRSSTLALATLVFPIAAALAFFADSILLLWTRDSVAAQAASSVVKLLALGTALHGIMFVAFALKLACGASKLALAIGVTLLAVSFPAIVVAGVLGGGTGAAAAWLMLNLAYLVGGSALTHWRLLPGMGYRWLVNDVAPPAALALGLAYGAAWWSGANGWSAGARTALSAVVVVACWVLMSCASRRLRHGLAAQWPRKSAGPR